MDALRLNCTWEEAKVLQGKKAVGCKWVFTVKCKANGMVEKFEARLVAKGFSQIYGTDYIKTFVPVAKLNIVRILISLAANLDWPLYQLDMKNAFLNGDLKEVYMKLPLGFPTTRNLVCKLKKFLYGLKQLPRAWLERFTQVLTREGFCPRLK